MLDVALNELPGGRQEQLRAEQVRPRVHEGDDILKLVAEPECAAGLIWAAARPHTARERLIQQPPVDEHIERLVGCPDLNGRQRLIPKPCRANARAMNVTATARIGSGPQRRPSRKATKIKGAANNSTCNDHMTPFWR